MPEDFHGADPRTVASTPESPTFTRSFAHNGRTMDPSDDLPVSAPDRLTAADFLAEYRAACAQTDRLFAAVRPDFLSSRPVAERHRLLFYIGHLEAFDWNLLALRAFAAKPFNAAFDRLFAFGIDPVGGGLPTDVPEDWPSLDQIREYRDAVRDHIETAIGRVDFSQPVRRLPEDGGAVRPAAVRDDSGNRANSGNIGNAEGSVEGSHGDDDGGAVSIATLCLVALEHRQMHAETLAYLIHQMPYTQKREPGEAYADAVAVRDTGLHAAAISLDGARALEHAVIQDGAAERLADAPMCAIPGGTVTMGLAGRFAGNAVGHAASGATALAHGDDTNRDPSGNFNVDADGIPTLVPDKARFGWDNEWVDSDAAAVSVPAFEIDRWMVTNGAFLRFLNAGGYENPEWWAEEDWAWRQAAGVSHPAFWERDARAPNGWRWRGMFAPLDLPLSWPVYVSRAEAAAYARFVGKRLPTEAEWLRAAEGVPGLSDASMSLRAAVGSESAAPDAPASEAESTAIPSIPVTQQTAHAFTGNADFRRWDPDAVDCHPENCSRFGVEGQFGNGWEWTADPFAPFQGFRAFPFYPGYSADFFDDKHFVMKGGSPRTAARMLRPSFRNWFQAHYPYVYAGFRCAR